MAEARVIVHGDAIKRVLNALRQLNGVKDAQLAPIQWGVRWAGPQGEIHESSHVSEEKAREFVDVWRYRMPECEAQLIYRTAFAAGPWLNVDGSERPVLSQEEEVSNPVLRRRSPAATATYHANRVAAILEDPDADAQQIREAAVAALIGLRVLAADLAAES